MGNLRLNRITSNKSHKSINSNKISKSNKKTDFNNKTKIETKFKATASTLTSPKSILKRSCTRNNSIDVKTKTKKETNVLFKNQQSLLRSGNSKKILNKSSKINLPYNTSKYKATDPLKK